MRKTRTMTTLAATAGSLAIAVGSLAVAARPLSAQEPDPRLIELLEANRYPVSLEDGRLSGSGGDVLLDAGRAARFVLVGEEHGVAETPGFTAAWFRGLIPSGYRHLAVEVGPEAGVLLDSLAGIGADAIGAFQEARAPGFPFFILRSESQLLANVRAALPDEESVIWGIDYDVLGDRYLFPILEDAATTDAAREVVADVRRAADAGLDEVLATGNPGELLLWSAPDEPFQRLRDALDPAPGSRADRVIETMRETAFINRLFMEGRNWESNHVRATGIKRSMARHLEAVRAAGEAEPRVMLKLGANHTYRGLNRTRQFDVGAMLAQVAEAEGSRSFHLLVVGGPGAEVARFNAVELRYETAPAGPLSATVPVEDLLLPDGWTLFDLRALRAPIHDGRVDVPEQVFDMVFNFDAVLVMTGSTPSQPWFQPGEVLRRPARSGQR